MRRLVFVWAALAALASAAALPGGPLAVDVRQRDRVAGRGPTLLFGDAVELVAEDAAVASALARVEVTTLARVAGGLTISRSQLTDAARRAGLDLGLARWSGPDVTFVDVAPVRLEPEEIASLARRKLEATLGERAAAATVRLLRVEGGLAACPGRRKTCFSATVRGTRLAGEVAVEVSASSDDVVAQTSLVYFEVRRRGPVLVARREIAAGGVVREQDLGLEERELAHVPEGSFERVDLAAGLVAARRVPAGTPVGVHDVRPRPVVLRGQDVVLRIAQGPLLITVRARVLQDGAPGDRIEVLHGGARKPVVARVVDAGLVEISADASEALR